MSIIMLLTEIQHTFTLHSIQTAIGFLTILITVLKMSYCNKIKETEELFTIL